MTPVEDRRPGVKDLAGAWCGSICPHRRLVNDWYTLMGASASAVPHLRVWGITSPWKLEES